MRPLNLTHLVDKKERYLEEFDKGLREFGEVMITFKDDNNVMGFWFDWFSYV